MPVIDCLPFSSKFNLSASTVKMDLAQCKALSVEGTVKILQEERVLLPGSSRHAEQAPAEQTASPEPDFPSAQLL